MKKAFLTLIVVLASTLQFAFAEEDSCESLSPFQREERIKRIEWRIDFLESAIDNLGGYYAQGKRRHLESGSEQSWQESAYYNELATSELRYRSEILEIERVKKELLLCDNDVDSDIVNDFRSNEVKNDDTSSLEQSSVSSAIGQ